MDGNNYLYKQRLLQMYQKNLAKIDNDIAMCGGEHKASIDLVNTRDYTKAMITGLEHILSSMRGSFVIRSDLEGMFSVNLARILEDQKILDRASFENRVMRLMTIYYDELIKLKDALSSLKDTDDGEIVDTIKHRFRIFIDLYQRAIDGLKKYIEV